ncbi:MAG: hypothetical protein KF805_08390 [Phycisphaeraceae bacterium]|nr:hypothetical protein [Phycisphaeraceae bacterium]
MSGVVGLPVPVSSLDCEKVCPRKGDVRTTGKVTDEFVAWSVNRLASGPAFRATAIRRHLDAAILYDPPELPALREALSPIADRCTLFLSGSAILTAHRPIGDLDVVALIADPDLACELKPLVPARVGDLKLDVFFRTRLLACYCHVAFDRSVAYVPDAGVVSVPWVYGVKSIMPSPLSIKLTEKAEGVKAEDAQRRRIPDSERVQRSPDIPKGCCG